MSRRRRSMLLQHSNTQDPGKDLFAYLFLLVMVFSFMLLVTLKDVHGQLQSQNGPDRQPEPTQSSISRIEAAQLGHLVHAENGLVLEFAGELYDPVIDVKRLHEDGRLIDGDGSKTLYLEERTDSQVLLNEYLEAFVNLNHAGINVAFAESVK
jgi:hypothetical protein